QMVPGVERAIVESGVILLKYWLEVSPEEQTRRLEARIDDGARSGSFPAWISSRIRAGTTTRGRVTRCSSPPTLHGRRGTSFTPTTKGGRGSTLSRTFWVRSLTRSCRAR